MKVIFKQSLILVFSAACSLMIVFYVKKFTYYYIVQNETENIKNVIIRIFPGYNSDKESTAQIDNNMFNYRSGTVNIDGVQKILVIFTSTVPGYYYSLKLISGIDEDNKITGIYMFRHAGALSSVTDNAEAINDLSQSGFIKDRDFPDGQMSDPVFLDQFKRIDFTRNIKIINTGTGKKILREEQSALNAVFTTPGNAPAVTKITGSLKNFLSVIHQVRSVAQESAAEVK